jgi:outer membrane cobalamin receptor
MKPIILFIFFSTLMSISTAQNAILKGTVKDSKTKETLVGVNVLYAKNQGIVTDVNGTYQLALQEGEYTIRYRLIGYAEVEQNIKLLANQTRELHIFLETEARVLDAVVVSAGRFEQKISDVTVSMEIIQPALIESNNITSLEEAIQKIPGIFVMDDQVSIRGGSGYAYGVGSRTLLLVDDMPLLTGSSGEARWDFAPLENLQQVEIIKGASSALYGSSALNGVINIRTGFASYEPLTSINMTSGIYGNPKRDAIRWWNTFSPFYSGARFSHAQQFGNIDLVFGGNAYSETGYQENNNEQRMRLNMNFRYRSRRIEGLSTGINTNFMDRTGSQFLLWLDGDSGVWRANPSFQQTFHNTSLNLYPYITYFPNQHTKHSLKTRLYRIRNTNDTGQNNFDDTYFAEYQYQRTLQNAMTLTSGMSGAYIESLSEIYSDTKHFGSNLALYTQLDHKLFSRLNISLGARLEGHRIDEEDLKFRPVVRTGLNYGIDEITFVRGSFGMGYRYPTISERYTATSTGAIRIFPNPNLLDETGWTSELALMRGFRISGWYGYIDIALFWTEYNNMIEFMFDYHNPDSITLIAFPNTHPNYFQNWIGFKAENVRNARITGIDFTVKGEGKFFGLPARLLAGYTYTNPIDMDTEKNDNNTSTNSNILKYRFYHNLKLDYEIQYKKISLGVNGEFCSHIINIDKAFEDTVRFPNGQAIVLPEGPVFLLPGLAEYRVKHNKGYFVFDIRIGWNVNEKVRFTAGVRNMFNREYMIRPADVQAPRTFVVQLNIRM